MTPQISSKLVLAALAVVLVGAACDSGGTSSKEKTAAKRGQAKKPPPSQHFRSRPDLEPPIIKIRTAARGTAPGYIFFAPKMVVAQAGPLILDDRGQVVWFHPLDTKGVADFKVQRYQGKPVLTWWRGRAPMGVGSGYYVIADDSYHEVARVRAGHGLTGDIHEFLITPRETALFTVYHQLHVDLRPVGGPKEGRIFDGIVQELDIHSGRVLFEWHSYPEVGIKESYAKPPPAKKGAKAPPYDYFHVNSIEEEPNGNLLVSARNTDTVYEISRRTGKILWRLGGKRTDFAMGHGTRFFWQHDARRQADGTITIFDNGSMPPMEKFSRVLVLRVDQKTRKATLARSYSHPKRLLVPFEGNAQFLPDGHIFVCWGALPFITEFDARGRVLFDAYFGRGKPPLKDADSYRAFRFAWTGHPTDRPAVSVIQKPAGGMTVYVSWNGATDVARWQVMAGSDPQQLRGVTTVAKAGFETAIAVPSKASYVAVRALSRSGSTLSSSRTLKTG
jgi:Arylsulfotransferase (ASST)